MLKGAAGASKSGRIRILWVESIPCQADALPALHFLQSIGYVLHGIASWGLSCDEGRSAMPNSRASLILEAIRPASIWTVRRAARRVSLADRYRRRAPRGAHRRLAQQSRLAQICGDAAPCAASPMLHRQPWTTMLRPRPWRAMLRRRPWTTMV